MAGSEFEAGSLEDVIVKGIVNALNIAFSVRSGEIYLTTGISIELEFDVNMIEAEVKRFASYVRSGDALTRNGFVNLLYE